MNSDTFAGLQGGTGRNALIAVTGVGTTETLVVMGTDTASTNATAVVGVPSQAAIIGNSAPLDPNVNPALLKDQYGRAGNYIGQVRPYFTSGSFDARGFRLRFVAKFTSSAAAGGTAHAFNLYWGNSITANNKIAAGLSTTALAGGNYAVIVEATCLWESVGQVLVGEYWAITGANYVSRTGLTNSASPTTYTALSFCASYKFNSGAANTVTPIEFSIEQF
ncbi:MAG: hypothetical protein JWQ87_2006 [Candidatus Sulfotelmatobacter sp.]|nr:hypothetical protein [Candidatus Sulfotelmatobacter sp.]